MFVSATSVYGKILSMLYHFQKLNLSRDLLCLDWTEMEQGNFKKKTCSSLLDKLYPKVQPLAKNHLRNSNTLAELVSRNLTCYDKIICHQIIIIIILLLFIYSFQAVIFITQASKCAAYYFSGKITI